MSKNKNSTGIALFSVISGLSLTIFKFIVGVATGSLGIISEALHSFLDLGAAVITYFSLKIANQPPDKTHNYGHGKFENLSALIQSILLLVTCIWITEAAISRMISGKIEITVSVVSFIVMIVSVLVDIVTAKILYSGAKKYTSQALEADALHYSSDILSSAIVIVGLIGAKLGYTILDPLAALGVAIMVSIASIKLGRRAIDVLLDRAPTGIAALVKKYTSKIDGIEKLETIRVRNAGSHVFIDLVISANRYLSLEAAHDLATIVENKLKIKIPNCEVMVHLHPSSTHENLIEHVKTIAAKNKEIKEVHNIIAYQENNSKKYFLCMHIKLDHSLDLQKAHNISKGLEIELKTHIKELDEVEVHIEYQDTIIHGHKENIPEEQMSDLENEISNNEKIKGIHKACIHNTDLGAIFSCHILTCKDISLEEAHNLADFVEDKARRIFPNINKVVVHTEPAE